MPFIFPMSKNKSQCPPIGKEIHHLSSGPVPDQTRTLFALFHADSGRLERLTRPHCLPVNLTVSRWLGFTRSKHHCHGPGGGEVRGRVCQEVECIVTQTMHYPTVLAPSASLRGRIMGVSHWSETVEVSPFSSESSSSPSYTHCQLTDCQRRSHHRGHPLRPATGDCQRLVTKHLPADRFAIRGRECC